jgi:hypothetical protein
MVDMYPQFDFRTETFTVGLSTGLNLLIVGTFWGELNHYQKDFQPRNLQSVFQLGEFAVTHLSKKICHAKLTPCSTRPPAPEAKKKNQEKWPR